MAKKPPPPPHHSFNASGRLNGFFQYRQTPYYRTIDKKNDPAKGNRWRFDDLSLAWAAMVELYQSLSAEEIDTWRPVARRRRMSPFNVFMDVNARRWMVYLDYSRSYVPPP